MMSVFSPIKSWIRAEHASTSVEFAMVGTGFIFLMIGILEFGRFAWTSNVIDYAVDEAARYAMIHQDAPGYEIEDIAKNTLDAFFVPSSSLSLDIAYTTASNVDFIEISGGYRFETMTRTILPESLRDINLNVNSRRPIYIYDENEE